MPYTHSPGRADALDDALLDAWNRAILRAYEEQPEGLRSRFFSLDPARVGGEPTHAVRWFGDPAEPAFCLSHAQARALSDWGQRGRQALHNEYCEYHVIHRADATGRMRAKRVEVTTELREYWLTLAVCAPERTRALAESVLARPVRIEELYGVSDVEALSPSERAAAFSTYTAGHGGDRELEAAGVPSQPIGPVNTERALFMSHPINGLDDLLYIVMFGAHAYARRTPEGPRRVGRDELFRAYGVERLACRHADPAAAMGAYAAAFEGRTLALADPLGMYITSFAQECFRVGDEALPDEWVRFSRGEPGWHQRLEFGPSDEEDAFLDDILVAEGANLEPLTGGYQVVSHVEIGPRLLVGASSEVTERDYVWLDAGDEPIRCSEAGACRRVRELQRELEGAEGEPVE